MQFKSLIRFPVDFRRAKQLLAEKSGGPSKLTERPIVLDLRSPQLLFDCGRHLASLAHYARSAGSPFFVRCTTLLLAGIARKVHGREMLAESHTAWIPAADPLPSDALVLCDYEPQGDRAAHIQMMIGRDIDREMPVMPYPMHPATLRHAGGTGIAELREAFARKGIFFAGNQKPRYGDAKIGRNFGVLSRLEIVRTLSEQFPSRLAGSIGTATHPQPIVLADSRVESIDASQWLITLAKAQFFVCCPGSSQPMCHNLIEAMSVGTVPLIEYGDRVTPELRDGEHAICFQGKAGLLNAIDRMDRLSSDQISRLSRGAARFYDDHLCGKKFLAALRDGRLDLSCRRVCMPFHDRNFYLPYRSVAA